jgi:16S rRNA (uracil1498-N3)-methyltransferase
MSSSGTGPTDTGPCFYCPELPPEGEAATLAEAEARHAGAARRIRVGDFIGLIDGRGTRASAVVESISRRALTFTVDRRQKLPPPAPSLIVATAVPKGERFRTMIDMLSQLGVAGIIPLECERGVVKPARSSASRWQRVAVEACKQSRNPYLPEIPAAMTLEQSLARCADADRLVYADARGGPLEDSVEGDGNLWLYVGPEGGFTDAEKALLRDRGARAATLGGNILRVETAAVAGAALAMLSAGRPAAKG